jgi:hypothetical protein
MRFLGGVVAVLLWVFQVSDIPAQTEEACRRSVFAGTMPSNDRQRLSIPDWFTNPPKDGFTGISALCTSIQAAREQALDSVIAQILQAMGAEYRFSHESMLSGSAHGSKSHLREIMSFTGRWFIHSVQQHIRKVDIQHFQDKYICFVLVEAGDEKLEDLRRLSIGPRPAARVVKSYGKTLVVEVGENNGVQITLTDYEIEMATKNTRAGLIKMFFWKVLESRMMRKVDALPQRISVRESSALIRLSNPAPPKSLASLVLGSKHTIRLSFRGYDEIGRPVSVSLSGF